MKSLSTLLTLTALAATSALAQMSQPMVSENPTRISDHVWGAETGKLAATRYSSVHGGRNSRGGRSRRKQNATS